ncbi:hypothetical protein BBP40_002534 [Aspergillus hancockii]|nr:hypothetical protein BBP40_002534 [Aspergillus hancockii]
MTSSQQELAPHGLDNVFMKYLPPETLNPFLIGLFTVVVACLWIGLSARPQSNIPLANPSTISHLKFSKQLELLRSGMQILSQCRDRYNGKPFRLLTELGDVVVLPPRFAHLRRNEASLDFGAAIAMYHLAMIQFDFHAHLSGFEPFGALSDDNQLLQVIVRKQLTKHLNAVTEPLSFEAAFAIDLIFGSSPVRRELAHARQIITPVIEKRRQAKSQAQAQTEKNPVPVSNNAIDLADMEANGRPYDPAILQLVLSFAAIHTASDLLAHTLILLSKHTDLLGSLRSEMIEVLRTHGWKKTAIYNLRLLDSALKESQRVKPNGMLPMRRYATKDLILNNEVIIRKGQRVCVDAYNMANSEICEGPEKYDPHRFMRIRNQPGCENKAHLVATSPEHLSFGHGMYACPGRVFAANEVKVALCHLILKYDWKLAPGSSVDPAVIGGLVRRRKEEINLASLEFD